VFSLDANVKDVHDGQWNLSTICYSLRLSGYMVP